MLPLPSHGLSMALRLIQASSVQGKMLAFACVCVHACSHMYVHVCACLHVRLCMLACVCLLCMLCMCVYMFAYVCACCVCLFPFSNTSLHHCRNPRDINS